MVLPKDGRIGATPKVNQSTEVLSQGTKLPHSPAKMALGGFVAVAALGYFVLYTQKKPEASAIDVAKVTTGNAKTPHKK